MPAIGVTEPVKVLIQCVDVAGRILPCHVGDVAFSVDITLQQPMPVGVIGLVDANAILVKYRLANDNFRPRGYDQAVRNCHH